MPKLGESQLFCSLRMHSTDLLDNARIIQSCVGIPQPRHFELNILQDTLCAWYLPEFVPLVQSHCDALSAGASVAQAYHLPSTYHPSSVSSSLPAFPAALSPHNALPSGNAESSIVTLQGMLSCIAPIVMHRVSIVRHCKLL